MIPVPRPSRPLGPRGTGTMVVTVLAACVAHWYDTPEIHLRAAVGHTVDLMPTGLEELH